jgi:hypothetical protein
MGVDDPPRVAEGRACRGEAASDGALGASAGAAPQPSGPPGHHGARQHRRDRHGEASLGLGPALGIMGGRVAGQQRKCGQTTPGTHPQGPSISAARVGVVVLSGPGRANLKAACVCPQRAPQAAQGKPCPQQACAEPPLGLREERGRAARAARPSTVVAVMVLCAVVTVPLFLLLGGLASRTHGSDHHSVLLTATGWRRVFGATVPQQSGGEHYMDIATVCTGDVVLWPSIRHAWSYARIALVPPERPGGRG